MTDANWVEIVLSQGQMVSEKDNIEIYKLGLDSYKFDTKKGTMRKLKGRSEE